jgi:hypothetical protein
MRIKRLTAAMGVAALCFCLFFSGCVLYPKEEDSGSQKSIRVTGFPGSAYSGKIAVIMLAPSIEGFANEEVTAMGGITVSGTTLSFPLFTDMNMTSPWNGTGNFIIMLGITTGETGNLEDIQKMFLYSDVMPNYTGSNVPKYRITDTVSTISFTDFIDVTDYL